MTKSVPLCNTDNIANQSIHIHTIHTHKWWSWNRQQRWLKCQWWHRQRRQWWRWWWFCDDDDYNDSECINFF